MKYLDKILVVAAGVCFFTISLFLIWPEWFAMCAPHDRGDGIFVCESPYSVSVGYPLLSFSLAYIVLSLVAIRHTTISLYRWLAFTALFGLLYVGYRYIAPGFLEVGIFTPNPAILARYFAVLYFGLSLFLLYKSELSEKRRLAVSSITFGK